MITIGQITASLEKWAPPAFQESYDNAGLLTGQSFWACTGALCTLDATEDVIKEAIAKNCNLVVAHHPIIFSGIKKWSGNGYVERAVTLAIKNDIAIYAIHTNLDNVNNGVNRLIAEKLSLRPDSLQPILPKSQMLCKLFTYVPTPQANEVREALFAAGAGSIGNYRECSFNTEGNGSFRPLEQANPAIGTAGGPREWVNETKVEVVMPEHLTATVVKAMMQAHPYETPAYEIIQLKNLIPEVGSGIIGELPHTMNELELLHFLKDRFDLEVIKHTSFLQKPVRTIAVCGGAGSFLTKAAIAAGANAFITADVKYHEFFDADSRILLADIGHFESEHCTIAGLANYLHHNFPNFAVLQTEVSTNPVSCFVG